MSDTVYLFLVPDQSVTKHKSSETDFAFKLPYATFAFLMLGEVALLGEGSAAVLAHVLANLEVFGIDVFLKISARLEPEVACMAGVLAIGCV